MHETGLQLTYSEPCTISNRRRVAGVADLPQVDRYLQGMFSQEVGEQGHVDRQNCLHWMSLLSDEEDKESSAK